MVQSFLVGMGGGTFIFSLSLDYWFGILLSLIMVCLGELILLLEIGHPKRLLYVIWNVKTSWISRGVVMMIAFIIIGIILYIIPTIGKIEWIYFVAITIAIVVSIYPGFVFSSSLGIPLWSTTILPILFLVRGLIHGLAGIYISNLIIPLNPSLQFLVLFQALLTLLSLTLIIMFIRTEGGLQAYAQESINMLTKGNLSMIFLGFGVILGHIAPLLLILYSYFVSIGFASIVASAFLLIGGVILNYSIISAGKFSPFLVK